MSPATPLFLAGFFAVVAVFLACVTVDHFRRDRSAYAIHDAEAYFNALAAWESDHADSD